MRKLTFIVICLIMLSACGINENISVEPLPPEIEPTTFEVVSTIPIMPTQEIVGTATLVVEATIVTTEEISTSIIDSCVENEFLQIAEGIAADYETVDTQQIVSWYCDGADINNIMLALQTESQSGFLAEDLLTLIAEGYTWEEVWDLVGLTGD